MKPEAFDRKITLQRFTSVQDETGQPIETWADLATVWAAKLNVSDSERMAVSEVSAQIDLRFQIRWGSSWASLNPKDRLVFDGRTFDIAGVKELGRRDGIEISATARADIDTDEIEPPDGDAPTLNFSIPTNSQYIGQVA